MRSLDEFNRYIEKQTGGPTAARDGVVAAKRQGKQIAVAPNSDAAAPAGVRYVLRGGVTIAVPAAKSDAPGNDVVAEETAAAHAALLDPPAHSEPVSRGEETTAEASASGDALLWQRLPRHIQLLIRLADSQEEEAAQKYYTRGFKESRRQLIERLLDPTLTLEDTARVLGVVPATVRRYTNRGVLPHHRTVGQQRRFRLSDVLAFLEAQQAGKIDLTSAQGGSDA